jgi:hypothetical protein
MWGTLVAYLRKQLGQRSDTASATGSLHAKVKDVKDTMPSLQKPRTSQAIGTSSGTPGSTYIQVGLITGRGMLMELRFYNSSSSQNWGGFLKVTVDDSTVYELPINIAPQSSEYPNPGFYFGDNVSLDGNSFNAMLSFKSSLKFEVKKNSDYGDFQMKWRTELE